MKNFKEILAEMEHHGMEIPSMRVYFKVADAKMYIQYYLSEFLKYENKQAKWITAYDEIAEWLSDNQGKGLFMYGNVGLGKSVLGRFIIPAILLSTQRKVVNVYDMQDINNKIDEVLLKKIICLDDIGTEEMSVRYGEKRMAFAEIMDMAEKNNNLVIITTNLNIDELRNKYGERILDRIKSITKRVLFKGKSFRG